jgi:hypothetical protein
MAATNGMPVPAKTVSPSRTCRAASMIISSSNLIFSAMAFLQQNDLPQRAQRAQRIKKYYVSKDEKR